MKRLWPLPSHNHECGSVLIATMLILTALTLAALFSATQSATETQLAANYKSYTEAFFFAEAGIEDAKSRLPDIVEDPPYTREWTYSLAGADPLHYRVRIRHKTERDLGEDKNNDGRLDGIIRWGDEDHNGTWEQNLTTGKPVEILASKGTAARSSVDLTAEAIRSSKDLKYAVWGDAVVAVQTDETIWQGTTTTPYVADVGSNEHVQIGNHAKIYGSVDIGRDVNGSRGTITDHGGTLYGGRPSSVKRVDPDPLGAFSAISDLYKNFARYRLSNDNARAAATDKDGNPLFILSGDSIHLEGNMTLPHGNYYLDSLTLRSGATLTIDVSAGPVNIYLTGSLKAAPGSTVTVNPSGSRPGQFTIYSTADDTDSSDASIDLRHDSGFSGVIYAPKANCQLQNKGNYNGMIWGRSVVIDNAGEVIYDPRLKRKFMSPTYTLRSWKEEHY